MENWVTNVRRTVFLHLGADPAGDGDLQVGGDEFEAAFVAGLPGPGLADAASGPHQAVRAAGAAKTATDRAQTSGPAGR